MSYCKWFPFKEDIKDQESYVFCFHHAGGSASVFRDWIQWSKNVQVIPVELPGKGMRQNEEFEYDSQKLVMMISEQILNMVSNEDIFLYGHSMGAALAFYISVELSKYKSVKKLLVSGRQAPHCPSLDTYHSSMSNEKLIEEMRRLNGTPEEILQNESLLNYILPKIRADYVVSESFAYHEEIGNFPIAGYCGSEDDVNYDSMLRWSEVTKRGYKVTEMEGNHFFPFDLGKSFWKKIEKEINNKEEYDYE